MKKILIATAITALVIALSILTLFLLPCSLSVKPNIAEIVSAWAALLAVIGAALAYQNWLSSKLQDDAYSLVKKYLEYLSQIEYEVIQVFTRLDGLCPAPGMLVVRAEEALPELEQIANKTGEIDRAVRLFHTAKQEFEFWGIELTDKGHELHKRVMEETWSFAVVMRSSIDTTAGYYTNNAPLEDITTVNEILRKRAVSLRTTFEERRNTGFNKLFELKH